MTTTSRPTDAGRVIAEAYWQRTQHVFSRSSAKSTECALCGLDGLASQMMDPNVTSFGSLLHIKETPEPKRTLASITDETPNLAVGRLGQPRYKVVGSCGHEGHVQLADRRRRVPEVGDPFDCDDCRWIWHDENHPNLPEDILESINAEVPNCPQCGSLIARIPFVVSIVHDFIFEADGQTGELITESDEVDTISAVPEWIGLPTRLDQGWETGTIEASCLNRHDFTCTRLAWRYRDGTHEWMVLPA